MKYQVHLEKKIKQSCKILQKRQIHYDLDPPAATDLTLYCTNDFFQNIDFLFILKIISINRILRSCCYNNLSDSISHSGSGKM